MPKNPTFDAQDGDYPGMDKTDETGGVSSPLEVAAASYNAGYLDGWEEATLETGYMSKADLKRGYTTYGPGVGEGDVDKRGKR